MLPTLPSLGIVFSIAKLHAEPYSYGVASWLIFLEAVPLDKIVAGALLFHGDTDDMRSFIIVVQSMNERTVSEIQSLVSRHPRFRQFCADPPFVSGPALFRVRLPRAGHVTATGVLEAESYPLKEAWEIFLKKKGASHG